MKRRRWSDADRQRFRDRDRLRAQRIPKKRRPPPTVDEWKR
jgi:hypothetical protein